MQVGSGGSPQPADPDSVPSFQAQPNIPVWLSGGGLHYSDRGSRRENQMFTAGKVHLSRYDLILLL